jgi:hypothetical protein
MSQFSALFKFLVSDFDDKFNNQHVGSVGSWTNGLQQQKKSRLSDKP